MSSLARRIARVRWMLVPLAAYLLVTLVLPAANGAASRGDFVRHGAWILGGCIAALAFALIGGTLVDVIRRKS